MAKGDFLEPLFEFALRVILPRHGLHDDDLSWPWMAAFFLACLLLILVKRHQRNAAEGMEAWEDRSPALQAITYSLWMLILCSAFLFRFGRALF